MLLDGQLLDAGWGLEQAAQDVRRVRDYAGDIDRRVARIEGVMEGYKRASDPSQRKLPPE